MPSNHLILCYPLFLLPSIFPSIGVFSKELAFTWPKYWSFSFSISLSNGYSRLTFFRIDLFDPLATKRFSKLFFSTTVWKHQFFGGQPSLWSSSHLYMILEKIIALTLWTFVGKVMSLLFNMLSSFVETVNNIKQYLINHARKKYFLFSSTKNNTTTLSNKEAIKE